MASMRIFQQLLILLLFSGCYADFIFSNPPNTEPGSQHYLPGWAIDNPIYQIGSDFDVKWKTDWEGYTVYLSQLQVSGISGYEGSSGNIVVLTKNSSETEAGGLNWTVEIGSFSITASNIFFFTAIDSASSDVETYGIFNVTEDAVTNHTPNSAISTSSSATPTNSASSTATSATTSAVPDTSATGSSSSSNDSLALGLGVGLGGALILMASIAAVLLYKVRHGKKKSEIPRGDQYIQLYPPSPELPKPEQNVANSYSRELPAAPVVAQSTMSRNYELHG